MKIIITESQLKLIYEEYESSSSSQVLTNNLKLKPELVPLYQEIEKKLGDIFTQQHFDSEKTYSGGLKNVATGLLPNAVENFNKMVNNYKLTTVKIKDNSFRDYTKQKDTFIQAAIKNGGKIKHGLRQAALPGFSQHHTGRAFDISSSNLVTDQMLSPYGFKRPYPTDTGFRMAEPWHIYYTK